MNITRAIAYPELEPTDMRRNVDYQFYFNCLGKFIVFIHNVTFKNYIHPIKFDY